MSGRNRVTGSLRRLAVSALAIAAVSVLLPTQPATAAFTSVNGVRLNGFEARLVTLINGARTSRGLGALTVTTGTTDLARKWSYAQAASDTMKHNPNLVGDAQWHGSPNWTQLAENVGKGYTPDSLFTAYMNSPGHRANILNGALRYLGMGWVERPDGWGYNTQVFTNQYSSSYGPARQPAYGGKLDRRLITSTQSLAGFESGTDARVLTSAAGTGIAASGVTYETPGTGDQAARFNVANTAGGTGGGAQFRLRDAVDLANVRAITLTLSATTRTQRSLTVDLYARSVLGTSVRVGSVSVPHGRDVTVTLALPSSARTYRNELALFVSRAALVALDTASYAGRGGTVYVNQITAVV